MYVAAEFFGISREFGGFVIFGNHYLNRSHAAMSYERVDSYLRFHALRFRLGLVVWLDELAQRSDATVEVMSCRAGFQHNARLRFTIHIGPCFRGKRTYYNNRFAFLQRLADVFG